MELTVEDRVFSPALQHSSLYKKLPILNDFFYATESDLGYLYVIDSSGTPFTMEKKGVFDSSSPLGKDFPEWMDFLEECDQMIVQNSCSPSLFPSLLLHPKMKSALLCPLRTLDGSLVILHLNSLEENHFGRKILRISEELTEKYVEKIRKTVQDENNN